MSFLPINNTRPASVPDAHAVRPASDHAERLQRQGRYRALAQDELAYAREARALGGAHAEHGVPNGVRRARTYWRMMLSERRRGVRFGTYEEAAQRRNAALRSARSVTPTPWDDLPAAGEIIEALRHGPMRTFALDTAVVIEGLAFSGRVVLRMGAQVWSLTTIDAAVIAILLRLQPDLRIAPLVADALSLGSRQAEQKVESVHRWSAVIQPVDGDEA